MTRHRLLEYGNAQNFVPRVITLLGQAPEYTFNSLSEVDEWNCRMRITMYKKHLVFSAICWKCQVTPASLGRLEYSWRKIGGYSDHPRVRVLLWRWRRDFTPEIAWPIGCSLRLSWNECLISFIQPSKLTISSWYWYRYFTKNVH